MPTLSATESRSEAQHIATAEKLGYRRANLFDTPFEGDDVWLGSHPPSTRCAVDELSITPPEEATDSIR